MSKILFLLVNEGTGRITRLIEKRIHGTEIYIIRKSEERRNKSSNGYKIG